MSGADKYESQYRERRGVCGEPFSEFAGFFASYAKQAARVLDLGCGQGRDALMAARHGHHVLGVDSAQTGISGRCLRMLKRRSWTLKALLLTSRSTR
ncbi:class I SAM-dependent methyltransferase [Candidatus Bipolaricaulota bacterium]